jgi:hypothetical protein
MRLSWALIILLTLIGLIRPLLTFLQLYDPLSQSWVPAVAALVIAAVWLVIVVLWRTPHPFATLAVTGALTGVVAAILLYLSLNVLRDIPQVTMNVLGYLYAFVFYLALGAFTGLVAKMFLGAPFSDKR